MRATVFPGLLLALIASDAACAEPPPGRFVEVRGARLYVETQGNGAPVLFLHGGLDHFDSAFEAQRDVFAASHRVVGIDQRGHGHSPTTPGRSTTARWPTTPRRCSRSWPWARSTSSGRAMAPTSRCCSPATIPRWCAAWCWPAATCAPA